MFAMKMLVAKMSTGKMLMAKLLNILCHTQPYVTKIINYQYLWASILSKGVGRWNSEYGEVRKGSSNSFKTI